MITFEVFLLGLVIVSTLTGLATEAVKMILKEFNVTYHTNTLTGIIATVLSALVGVCYVIAVGIAFTAPIIVYIIGLVFLSWLCAMVGYDKVVQAVSQFKTTGKD